MTWRSLILLPLLSFAIPALGGPAQVIDARFHHLRNVDPPEWSRFSESPEGDRLKVVFDLESPESFRLLTWRQSETALNVEGKGDFRLILGSNWYRRLRL